mgnify:CR=1 FL=1
MKLLAENFCVFDQKTNFLLRPDQKLFYDFKGVLNDNRFDLAKKLINMFK